jgi:hypothetical protein
MPVETLWPISHLLPRTLSLFNHGTDKWSTTLQDTGTPTQQGSTVIVVDVQTISKHIHQVSAAPKLFTYSWKVHPWKLEYLSSFSSVLPSKCLERIFNVSEHMFGTKEISRIFISEFPRNNRQKPQETLNRAFVSGELHCISYSRVLAFDSGQKTDSHERKRKRPTLKRMEPRI